MYGTVARMKVRAGMEADFERLAREMEESFQPEGWVSSTIYRMDSDPREYYLAVVFESRELYFANADDPRQHELYVRLAGTLDGEPEWHDGEVVFAKTA